MSVTFVIASRNRHKVEEIAAVLGAAVDCISLAQFQGAPEVAENASTFAGNAELKARSLARWLRGQASLPRGGAVFVLADDSGLEVDALDGAPGVKSARYAAEEGSQGNATDAANNLKLLTALRSVPEAARSARFRCSIALVPMTDEAENSGGRFFEGTCEGRIQMKPSGVRGFGYDPLFVPVGYDQSFAELGEDIKNLISHRSNALKQLKRWFVGTPSPA